MRAPLSANSLKIEDLLSDAVHQSPYGAHIVNLNIARQTVEIVRHCLRSDPRSRYARLEEIVRALDALSAVSGHLFRSGGGCSFYFGRRTAFDTIHTGAAARHVREPMFGQDVLAAQNPKIRAIWVTAGNPVCMLPGAAEVDRGH